jgi:hypothetical protein
MTESVTEAVNRVLLAVNEEATAMRQATEASRNAVFGLLGIITGRMQQYEDRIANLEKRMEDYAKDNLPEPGDIDPDWLENFGMMLWDRHLQSSVQSAIDVTAAETAAEVFNDMIENVELEVDRIDVSIDNSKNR